MLMNYMKNLKNGLINLYNMSKKFNYTRVIIVLCLLVGAYFIYNIIQEEHDKLQRNFKTIDSLNFEIQKIDSLHRLKDSTIIVYKDSIIYLDKIIEKDKIKIIKIQEKYGKVHPIIIKYTNTQLDSFFSKRYGY